MNGVPETYLLDTAAGLTQVLVDGNNTYQYGVGRIAQVGFGGTEYFLGDALDSVKRTLEAEWDSTIAAWRDYRLDITQYYPNTSGVYLVGLPGYTNRYRCLPDKLDGHCSSDYSGLPPVELIESSAWNLYDGQSWFSDPPTAGVLTGRVTALDWTDPGHSGTYYQDENYAYDPWGNRTQTIRYKAPGTFYVRQTNDPLVAAQFYDPVYHTFVVSETNAISQTTAFGYDFDLGLPTSMTGPNGVDTTITVDYDDFGRLIEVVRPGDSSPTSTLKVIYEDDADNFWIEIQQCIEENQYAKWRKVYNGLGLLIQAQTANAELQEGARDILVDYAYDSYGNVVTQTVPYTTTTWDENGTPYRPQPGQASSRTDYDLLGRQVIVRAPDQTTTQYRYFDRESWATDALSNTTKTIYDAWGRVIQVRPAITPTVSYSYDARDQLVGVSRGGVSTAITYDMGGRKLAMSDPDMGVWSYAYDALGNLTRQTDARGQRVCLYYDDINRMLGKHYRTDDNCPTGPSYDVSFGYDGVSEGYYNLGRRTVMTDTTGVAYWDYDVRGQLMREERQITGQGIFVTEWGYNSAGLLDWMKYPGGVDGQTGEQVNYAYYNQLTLDSVEGSEKYVDDTAYDAAGRMAQRVLGNQAVVNGYAYHPWTQQGGRLQRMTSGVSCDPTSLQDLRYAYDLVGNVLSIQDYKMGSPQTQAFAYDALYRLISAQASDGSDGNYDPESYSYSTATGNLESKAGVSYTYGDPSHAHAVTALSNGWSYVYDPNGNMTQRNLGSQAFNLAYDPENHLVQVSGTVTATFGYDGDSKRVLSTEGVTTTVYLGNFFEMSVSGGITSTIKYYYAGSERVAMRQNEGTVKWLLGDHLGSTSLVYDGSETIRQGYKAWGERWFILGAEDLPTTFRYTGQREEASIGLYYYGARWYDPALGRFAQADTIIPEAGNPQAWDRYTYSINNPLRYIDPTGHFKRLPKEKDDGNRWDGNRWYSTSKNDPPKEPVIVRIGNVVVVIMPPGSSPDLIRSDFFERIGMGLAIVGEIFDAGEFFEIAFTGGAGGVGPSDWSAFLDVVNTQVATWLNGQSPFFDKYDDSLPLLIGTNQDVIVQFADFSVAAITKLIGVAAANVPGLAAGVVIDAVTTSFSFYYDDSRNYSEMHMYFVIGVDQDRLIYIIIWPYQ